MRVSRKYEAIPAPLVGFDYGHFFANYFIDKEGWLVRADGKRAAIKRSDGAWRVAIKAEVHRAEQRQQYPRCYANALRIGHQRVRGG